MPMAQRRPNTLFDRWVVTFPGCIGNQPAYTISVKGKCPVRRPPPKIRPTVAQKYYVVNMPAPPSAEDFIRHGEGILNRTIVIRNDTFDRRWKAHFGTSPENCVTLWNMCRPYETMPKGVMLCHLLWALLFLKLYNSEEKNAGDAGADEKTYRKWTWLFVEEISFQEAKTIMWESRFLGNFGNQCLVSIDGTDVPVEEQGGFSSKFFSHKFRSAGLKYEVGVCIQSGRIVWVNGPFRCGMNDLQVSRQALTGSLDEGEMVEADRGYQGEPMKIKTPGPLHNRSKEEERSKDLVRARHETVNGRLKYFRILRALFRHDIRRHSSVFRAVAVITELNIEEGDGMFPVFYNDSLHSY